MQILKLIFTDLQRWQLLCAHAIYHCLQYFKSHSPLINTKTISGLQIPGYRANLCALSHRIHIPHVFLKPFPINGLLIYFLFGEELLFSLFYFHSFIFLIFLFSKLIKNIDHADIEWTVPKFCHIVFYCMSS